MEKEATWARETKGTRPTILQDASTTTDRNGETINAQLMEMKKETRSIPVALRVTPSEKKKMVKNAKKDNRSLTNFIVTRTT